MSSEQKVIVWDQKDIENDEEWESAYRKFETPQQEIQKFFSELDSLS